MNDKFNDFPQYRAISGRKVYYKISSDRFFEEISWIGEKIQVFKMNATQYPEMLRIADMLNCEEPYILLSERYHHLFD